MNSLDEGVWCYRYFCKGTKVRVFSSLVIPVSLYSCETWTLTGELRRRLNYVASPLGTVSLRRILSYRLHRHDSVYRVCLYLQFVSLKVRTKQSFECEMVFMSDFSDDRREMAYDISKLSHPDLPSHVSGPKTSHCNYRSISQLFESIVRAIHGMCRY